MNNNNFETLQKVFNTLMLIETRGENTMIMAQCLQAIQEVIQSEGQRMNEAKIEPVTE